MKIGIIGTGAMGSIYASFFARNGFQVTCYDIWEEHINAINANGLRAITAYAMLMCFL